jgi:lipid II:glycine glycyltransferase (peptidoglycan interpeptide bridge formation enzyme)
VKPTLLLGPSEIATGEWSGFVLSHPDGSVFQLPEMFEFFRTVPKFSPSIVAVKDGSGRLAGILLAVTIREFRGLSAFFSSRTVIYGGPLIRPDAEDREEILDLLLKGLIRIEKKHAIFIQFRNFFNLQRHIATFESKGFYLRDRLNLLVDTSSEKTVIKNMSASRWRQIRKGSEVAKIIVPSSLSQVRAFYDILHNLYRYKVKKPLPPWEFFEQFYRFSRQGKLGVILLVEFKGKIIGGILSPVTPGKTIYEWYVCGLDHEYKEVHPSVLATWASMEYALQHNIPQFDFMGVGIPGREYGVREFKSRFGGEMVNYGRYARINNRAFYFVAEVGYNFLTWFRKI